MLGAISDANLSDSLGFVVPSSTSVIAPPLPAVPPAIPSRPKAGDASIHTAQLTSTTPLRTSQRADVAVYDTPSQAPVADLRLTHYSLPSSTPPTARSSAASSSSSLSSSSSSPSVVTPSDGLSFALSEALLVRDMLYVFQGIDGTYVRYYDAPTASTAASSTSAAASVAPRGPPSPHGGYRICDSTAPSVPQSTRQLVCRLGEVGWLFRKVTWFLEQQSVAEALGRVSQALCAALQEHVASHFGDIAALGMQLDQRLLASSHNPHTGGVPQRAVHNISCAPRRALLSRWRLTSRLRTHTHSLSLSHTHTLRYTCSPNLCPTVPVCSLSSIWCSIWCISGWRCSATTHASSSVGVGSVPAAASASHGYHRRQRDGHAWRRPRRCHVPAQRARRPVRVRLRRLHRRAHLRAVHGDDQVSLMCVCLCVCWGGGGIPPLSRKRVFSKRCRFQDPIVAQEAAEPHACLDGCVYGVVGVFRHSPA